MPLTDEQAWVCLRQPFALTPGMQLYHQCQWEVFDVDAAGCLLCGRIHRCCARTCRRVQTEDAEVCDITGLCVVDRLYADTEYADTVASYNMGKDLYEKSSTVDRTQILELASQLLVSETSKKVYDLELKRFRMKLHSLLHTKIKKRKGPVNMVTLLESVIAEMLASSKLAPTYNEPLRHKVLEKAVDNISFIINACIFHMGMPARDMETRILVFGLLYLMRSGVVIEGVQIIPRIPVLKTMLPAENILQPMYGFRPKYVTDVENKFKFMFRGMSMQKVQKLYECSRELLRPVDGN